MSLSRSGIIAFTTFVAILTLLSIVHEYNLNFDEIFKYILIAIAIITVITVGITVCYVCSQQIHTMLDNKLAEAHHHLTSDSVSIRSMDFRSNISVIQMMERLSQFSDCAVKTLPSYNKAMFSSYPVKVATTEEMVQSFPPPSYTSITIPSAFLEECPPPPNYDVAIATNAEDELPVYSTSTSLPSFSDPKFCTQP